MKRRLVSGEIDITRTGLQWQITLADPGDLVRARIVQRETSRIIATRDKPPMVPMLELVFECDPDQTPRPRKFLALPMNVTVTADYLRFLTVCDDPARPDGTLAIYEDVPMKCDRAVAGVAGQVLRHAFPNEGTGRCECSMTTSAHPETPAEGQCAAGMHWFEGSSSYCMCGAECRDGLVPS